MATMAATVVVLAVPQVRELMWGKRGRASTVKKALQKTTSTVDPNVRERCTAAIGYDGSISAVPELKWTQTAYISPQMHPYDRYFFDPALCVHSVCPVACERVTRTPRADHPPRRCAEGMALAALVTRWTSGSVT